MRHRETYNYHDLICMLSVQYATCVILFLGEGHSNGVESWCQLIKQKTITEPSTIPWNVGTGIPIWLPTTIRSDRTIHTRYCVQKPVICGVINKTEHTAHKQKKKDSSRIKRIILHYHYAGCCKCLPCTFQWARSSSCHSRFLRASHRAAVQTFARLTCKMYAKKTIRAR